MFNIEDCQPVRWRRTERGAKGVITLHEVRSALIVGRGRKWLHVIPTEAPVRIVKVPLEDERDMVPLLLHGNPYPVPRCVRILKRLRKTAGGTDEAKDVLARLARREPAQPRMFLVPEQIEQTPEALIDL